MSAAKPIAIWRNLAAGPSSAENWESGFDEQRWVSLTLNPSYDLTLSVLYDRGRRAGGTAVRQRRVTEKQASKCGGVAGWTIWVRAWERVHIRR